MLKEGYGYVLTSGGVVLKYILTVFTLGIIHLIFYWKPTLKIKLFYKKCPIAEAQTFVLEVKLTCN